tara:strand:- start:5692 stop:7413 length:1722 start_codon:yes stop_codon:yes gene_type:complete
MKYKEFVEVYESLSGTTKKLEKSEILSVFLKKLAKEKKWDLVYLLRGRVVADYDSREFGISGQLTIKAIAKALGIDKERVVKEFRKVGDLGEIAESFVGKKKQGALFKKELTVDLVFNNLRKLMEIEGKGSIDKKMGLIAELLGSATGKEAKYITRTLLSDLRVGVADALLRDGIAWAFFKEDERKEASLRVEKAYDLANDFSLVFKAASKGEKELAKVGITPGRAMKVMLPVKVADIKDAFRICGRPAAIEHKYDGFRMLINKDSKGKVSLFTRRLENVTEQFPDVVDAVKKNVKGKSFILDAETVGYDPKTKKYRPFEAISQRIRRKYDIDKLIKKLPVEINSFDILYLDGKNLMDLPFSKRREILEKTIKKKEMVIRPSTQIVTGDDKEALKFYKEALKIGEEGIMIKTLEASYRQGRRVGYIVKMKPEERDLDLVIVGAEYGSGKRGGLLTSYIVACSNGKKGEFLEVGKVASGLKEKDDSGEMTYSEMSELLKPLIIEEGEKGVRVKPKIIVSVTYQNVQGSPSYNSGLALRFPRITNYRPDMSLNDVDSLEQIKKEAKKHRRPSGLA